MTEYSTKKAAEIVRVKFELKRIASAVQNPVVSVHLREGKSDPAMNLMVVADSTIAVGSRVEALIQAGIPGNIYLVRCTFETPDGQRLIEEALLPVV